MSDTEARLADSAPPADPPVRSETAALQAIPRSTAAQIAAGLAGVLGLSDAVAGAWIGGNIDTTAAVAASAPGS